MKYTVWVFQQGGFGHGWKSEQADTIPEGAVSASTFEPRDADRAAVYVVENAPPVAKEKGKG